MSVNLARLISHISSNILHPLAGNTGVYRQVETIVLLEDTSASQNLCGRELVLSGEFLLQYKKESLIDYIAELNAMGCAGLCLKAQQDAVHLDKEVLQCADDLQFPLYEILPSVSLTEVSKMLYRRIVQMEPLDFEYVLSVIRALSELTVSGGTLEAIINMMAQKLSNTVMFLNTYLFVSAIQTVLPGWRKDDLYPSKGQRFFTSVEQMQLEKGFSDCPASPYQDRVIRNGRPVPFILFPARWENSLIGYLCILSTNKPFSLLEPWVSENFLPILAQSICSKPQSEMSMLNFDDLFMWQVILQQNPDVQRVKQYCALCNFDYNAVRICMTMEYPTLEHLPAPQRNGIMEKQRAYMDHCLTDHKDTKKLILIHENYLTILRTVPHDMPRIAVILEHELLGAKIVQDISTKFGLDCFIGLSETCKGLDTLNKCYFEAMESIVLGKKIRPDQSCFSYHEQYLFHRLWHNFTIDELHEICVNILEPIMDNTPDFIELRRTLEAYISCTGNLSQTAERLFIHRNTLNYRMAKLKSLLAVKEITADDFTRYMVGLTILKII